MKRSWKGREAITPELIAPFEEWEAGPWRERLTKSLPPEVLDRLEILAFDRANELAALDLGRTISTNWPARFSGFVTECASLLRLDRIQERALKNNFESVIESLSNEARHVVSSARRSTL